MLAWREVDTIIPQGVMVASNEKQEWLLPWWWENYVRYNNFPVTFVDFGLSEEGKTFCRQRGELVQMPFCPPIGEKEDTKVERGEFWETIYGSRGWWEKRSLWHKKPIALLQTPYQHTLWLDTDCEVHASLLPLFIKIAEEEAVLICPEPEEAQKHDRERGHIFADEILFNSGVIGFTRESPYILEWACHTLKEHGDHLGDQNLLSRLIYEKKWPTQILDRLYNWRQLTDGKNPDVKITHWVGDSGKFFISMKKLHLLP